MKKAMALIALSLASLTAAVHATELPEVEVYKSPYCGCCTEWSKHMLDNGFKLEVEALISRDISYVTEEYTPARLAEQDWLD